MPRITAILKITGADETEEDRNRCTRQLEVCAYHAETGKHMDLAGTGFYGS